MANSKRRLQVVHSTMEDRSCYLCRHIAFRTDSQGSSSWCGLYDDPIDDEALEARKCGSYDQEDR